MMNVILYVINQCITAKGYKQLQMNSGAKHTGPHYVARHKKTATI